MTNSLFSMRCFCLRFSRVLQSCIVFSLLLSVCLLAMNSNEYRSEKIASKKRRDTTKHDANKSVHRLLLETENGMSCTTNHSENGREPQEGGEADYVLIYDVMSDDGTTLPAADDLVNNVDGRDFRETERGAHIIADFHEGGNDNVFRESRIPLLPQSRLANPFPIWQILTNAIPTNEDEDDLRGSVASSKFGDDRRGGSRFMRSGERITRPMVRNSPLLCGDLMTLIAEAEGGANDNDGRGDSFRWGDSSADEGMISRLLGSSSSSSFKTDEDADIFLQNRLLLSVTSQTQKEFYGCDWFWGDLISEGQQTLSRTFWNSILQDGGGDNMERTKAGENNKSEAETAIKRFPVEINGKAFDVETKRKTAQQQEQQRRDSSSASQLLSFRGRASFFRFFAPDPDGFFSTSRFHRALYSLTPRDIYEESMWQARIAKRISLLKSETTHRGNCSHGTDTSTQASSSSTSATSSSSAPRLLPPWNTDKNPSISPTPFIPLPLHTPTPEGLTLLSPTSPMLMHLLHREAIVPSITLTTTTTTMTAKYNGNFLSGAPLPHCQKAPGTANGEGRVEEGCDVAALSNLVKTTTVEALNVISESEAKHVSLTSKDDSTSTSQLPVSSSPSHHQFANPSSAQFIPQPSAAFIQRYRHEHDPLRRYRLAVAHIKGFQNFFRQQQQHPQPSPSQNQSLSPSSSTASTQERIQKSQQAFNLLHSPLSANTPPPLALPSEGKRYAAPSPIPTHPQTTNLLMNTVVTYRDRLVRYSPSANPYFEVALVEGVRSVKREENERNNRGNDSVTRRNHDDEGDHDDDDDSLPGILSLAPPNVKASPIDAMTGNWNMSDLPPWLTIPPFVNVANCIDPILGVHDNNQRGEDRHGKGGAVFEKAPLANNLNRIVDDDTAVMHDGEHFDKRKKSILIIGSSHGRNIYSSLCQEFLMADEKRRRVEDLINKEGKNDGNGNNKSSTNNPPPPRSPRMIRAIADCDRNRMTVRRQRRRQAKEEGNEQKSVDNTSTHLGKKSNFTFKSDVAHEKTGGDGETAEEEESPIALYYFGIAGGHMRHFDNNVALLLKDLDAVGWKTKGKGEGVRQQRGETTSGRMDKESGGGSVGNGANPSSPHLDATASDNAAHHSRNPIIEAYRTLLPTFTEAMTTERKRLKQNGGHGNGGLVETVHHNLSDYVLFRTPPPSSPPAFLAAASYVHSNHRAHLDRLKGLFTHIIVVPSAWEIHFHDSTIQEHTESMALSLDLYDEVFAPSEKIIVYNSHTFHPHTGGPLLDPTGICYNKLANAVPHTYTDPETTLPKIKDRFTYFSASGVRDCDFFEHLTTRELIGPSACANTFRAAQYRDALLAVVGGGGEDRNVSDDQKKKTVSGGKDKGGRLHNQLSVRERVRKAWSDKHERIYRKAAADARRRSAMSKAAKGTNTSTFTPAISPHPVARRLDLNLRRAPMELVDVSVPTAQSLGHLLVDTSGHHTTDGNRNALTQRILRDHICPPKYVMAIHPELAPRVERRGKKTKKIKGSSEDRRESGNVFSFLSGQPHRLTTATPDFKEGGDYMKLRAYVDYANAIDKKDGKRKGEPSSSSNQGGQNHERVAVEEFGGLPWEFPFKEKNRVAFIRVRQTPHSATRMPSLRKITRRNEENGANKGRRSVQYEIFDLFPTHKLPLPVVYEGLQRAIFDHPYAGLSSSRRRRPTSDRENDVADVDKNDEDDNDEARSDTAVRRNASYGLRIVDEALSSSPPPTAQIPLWSDCIVADRFPQSPPFTKEASTSSTSSHHNIAPPLSRDSIFEKQLAIIDEFNRSASSFDSRLLPTVKITKKTVTSLLIQDQKLVSKISQIAKDILMMGIPSNASESQMSPHPLSLSAPHSLFESSIPFPFANESLLVSLSAHNPFVIAGHCARNRVRTRLLKKGTTAAVIGQGLEAFRKRHSEAMAIRREKRNQLLALREEGREDGTGTSERHTSSTTTAQKQSRRLPLPLAGANAILPLHDESHRGIAFSAFTTPRYNKDPLFLLRTSHVPPKVDSGDASCAVDPFSLEDSAGSTNQRQDSGSIFAVHPVPFPAIDVPQMTFSSQCHTIWIETFSRRFTVGAYLAENHDDNDGGGNIMNVRRVETNESPTDKK